ncbi:peptidoglycan editing factor PgeF [Saccharicrinis sp. FJH54]|uniref:peptidoglycan editing factor PgeF n=1 Tax=Saccharicrinis sp. FJH54 TaxID=3344665 RepID=UPI0035D4172E
MILKELSHITVYQHSVFENFPEILQLTTSRKGGVSLPPYDRFNLGENTADDPHAVVQNLNLLRSEISAVSYINQFILPVQVHGDSVLIIDKAFSVMNKQRQTELLSSCDAMITKLPNTFIGIRTADCVPVTVYDKHSKSVAVIHAGWRGIENGIIEKTLRNMQIQDMTALFCGIGPCIEADVYEVGKEVVDKIKNVLRKKPVYFRKNNAFFLDLKKAAFYQLEGAGIPSANIETSSFCTWKNNDAFFSYRKEKGNTGRFLTGMMIKTKV